MGLNDTDRQIVENVRRRGFLNRDGDEPKPGRILAAQMFKMFEETVEAMHYVLSPNGDGKMWYGFDYGAMHALAGDAKVVFKNNDCGEFTQFAYAEALKELADMRVVMALIVWAANEYYGVDLDTLAIEKSSSDVERGTG